MNRSVQPIKLSSTRAEHIWYYICIVGIFCLGYATYHILVHSDILGAGYVHIVHTIWQVLWHILGIFLVSNTVSLIFREIKYSFAQVHTLVRKFLPLLRFISLSLVWIVGTLILVKSFDIDITTILTGAGIGGIIFALASRDIFSNIFGNISILMSKMFDIWDRIKTSTYEGVVEEISLNYTKIAAIDGHVVYIPNRKILAEPVENISRQRFFQHIWRIPFDRRCNPADIENILSTIRNAIIDIRPISWRLVCDTITGADIVYVLSCNVQSENKALYHDIQRMIVEQVSFKRE